MVTIQPLEDRVLVRRLEEEGSVTKGGIHIPDNAREKSQEGVVLAIGDGRRDAGVLVPLTVKVGDKILFGKYSGSEVDVDGARLLVMREGEIIGIMHDTAAGATG
jgi:chaperonin GroES